MSDGRAPRLLLAVCLAVFLLTALLPLCGCKKKGEAAGTGTGGGRRLALGGADAVEDAFEDAEDTRPQAATQADQGAGAAESAGAARRGPRGGGGAQAARAGGGEAGAGRGPGAGRGGRRGGGRAAGPGAGAAPAPAAEAAEGAAAEAEPGAGEEAAPKAPATGIPEVDKMAKVREFAALFGPVTLINSKDWDGTEFEWVSVTAEEGKVKGRQIVMPVGMVLNAEYLEVLEGYFPIYVRAARPLGQITSKDTITEPRKPKRTLDEIRKLQTESLRVRLQQEQAAQAEAAAAGEAATAGPGGPGGMRGGPGGMRGGRRGMRGGRRGM